MPLLELSSITKEFPGVRALDDVSFELEAGQIHALCGENGAGKSTLIKVLCGAIPAGAYGGSIRLRGREVRFRNVRAAEEAGITLIAQELALVNDLSVEENLFLGREPTRRGLVDRRSLRAQALVALERVGLSISPHARVLELGIAQQQLVEIAKALSKDASILVLDEPTSALASHDAERLFELLDALRLRGVSCLYISHRLEEVFRLADRVTVLRQGRTVVSKPTSDFTPREIVRQMVGREVENLYPRPAHRPGALALRVRNWNVADPRDSKRRVVSNLSFEVAEGEIVGIGGLLGAGRTALLASLFGAARSPVSGELHLPNRTSTAPFHGPSEAIGAGMALVSEDRARYGLLPDASVEENVSIATLRRTTRHGFLDRRVRRERVLDQIRRLAVHAPSVEMPARQLSGGNQQKVILGRWFLTEPRVLLLDEPTRGIDVGAKVELYELVDECVGRGLAVLLVTSELSELLSMSHRILVLRDGRESAAFSDGQATGEAVLAAATGAL